MTPSFLKQDFRVRWLAVTGILVLVNILLATTAYRWDLTSDKVYTLSPASRAIVSRLERPLHVKAYFTKDLQAPYNAYEEAVRDKLDEYKAYANGKLVYEFIDPTGDEGLEEEARRFGVSAAKIDFRSRDQREIKTAYMGVAFVYGDTQEVIPIIRNLGSLEYEISRIIRGLTSEQGKQKIGFLQGHGEPDLLRPMPQGGPNPIRQAIDENYEVAAVDMTSSADIPDDIDALIVFAPMEEIPERHQLEIDQFLMQGKPVGFFIPSHTANTRASRLQPINSSLENLLQTYGIKLTKKLVIDRRQNGRTRFPVRQGPLVFQALINYPLFPMTSDFNRDSIIVRDVDAMILPMSQALELTEVARESGGIKATPLIRSSSFSTIKTTGQPPVDPQKLMDKELAKDEQPGPFVLAYTLEGMFDSHWAEQPLPTEDDGTPVNRTIEKKSPETRMIVVGGAEFLRTSAQVFLNMVDWLAQDDELISIRPRAPGSSILESLEPETQRLIGLTNVAGLPALFIIFGLIRWQVRRRTRFSVE